MSILQDLDPQYAKIHAQSSFTWKPVILSGAALLVLGSASWALMQAQARPISQRQTPATSPTQVSTMADEMTRSVTQTTAPIAKQEIPAAMTQPPSASAGATIREDAQHTTGTEQRIPAPPVSSETAAGSLGDTEYRRQKPATTGHAKANLTHDTGKPERRSAAAQAAARSEKSQLSGGKRTNERDIDIITAIVR